MTIRNPDPVDGGAQDPGAEDAEEVEADGAGIEGEDEAAEAATARAAARPGESGPATGAAGSATAGAEGAPDRTPSIAAFASLSASLLRSRGIHEYRTDRNPRASFDASAASGRSPGCLICQRPDICST